MNRIGFISLGCSKNRVDTEVMLGLLDREGYIIVNKLEEADIVIVNTCGFITPAKEEAVNTLLEMAELKKKGVIKKLIAAGCLVQRYANDLAREIPEIDGLVGVSHFTRIAEAVRRLEGEGQCFLVGEFPPRLDGGGKRLLSTPPGWAYLKIAEGCDNRCSYCAIPLIRGHFRSRPLPEIVAEAEWLSQLGVKELVLIAQDTSMYGRDIDGDIDLAVLLEHLSNVHGIEWIRVMYTHPLHLNQRMIEVMAKEPKVIPYLDLPVQHANDAILSRMGRGYSRSRLARLLDELRSRLPELVLRTTVMVGFPGEDESRFEDLCLFIQESCFDWLGAFTYSPEEGTAACRWVDDVPEKEKRRRWCRVMEIQSEITSERNRARVGRVERILVEGSIGPGTYQGRGYYQAPEVDGITVIKSERALKAGQMVEARLVGWRGYDMVAEVLS